MLFVDDNEARSGQGGEHGGAGANDNMRLAGARALPRPVAFRVAEACELSRHEGRPVRLEEIETL